MTSRLELIDVLCKAKDFLAMPGNDFVWSSWDDAQAALSEIDQLIATIKSGQLPSMLDITVLFAPTGPIQEVSLSSGWGEEFLDLAERFDAVVELVYKR
jgi:hypothetical protein